MMVRLLVALLAIAVLLAAALAYAYAFGRMAQRRTGPPSLALPPAADETPLDRELAGLAERHPGASGLRLIVDSLEAFALRHLVFATAGRSIDIQSYIWRPDLTGRLLALELLKAADRGVRVRVLLDDINSASLDSTYVALDSHPHVEVRLFNPSRSRTGPLRRGLELILTYFTATRRMHNKNLVADGRLAIVGGRNMGDEYFDAARHSNFRDVDLLVAGPAAGKAATIFDAYWNSPSALPIRALHRMRRPRLDRLRARLAVHAGSQLAERYIADAHACLAATGPAPLTRDLRWSSAVTVIADPPEKADGQARDRWLIRRITGHLEGAERSIRVASPYFIPGKAGAAQLCRLSARGVDVAVLTNSLAATDVLAVHGAYARYRRPLLACGIRLYELKAVSRRHTSLFGSRTASLHTKAYVIDGELGLVGSFNLDPRSASINTEMGITFVDAVLAAELAQLFDAQVTGDACYGLALVAGNLAWGAGAGPQPAWPLGEPGSSFRRSMAAWLIGLLPIESQL